MSYRHRPVLARKHRPRWQDELRTQQLVVAGFALAIAVALGLFGAWVWAGFYDGHLRQVAFAAGSRYSADDVSRRQHVLESELFSRFNELQSQMGTPQDAAIQQQLVALEQEVGRTGYEAAESLVRAAVQRAQAGELGVTLDEQRADALFIERTTVPLRLRLSAIYVDAETDAPGEEPTEQQMTAARNRAEGLLAQLRGGRDFATLASEKSDDASASSGGDLGWSTQVAPRDEALFEASRAAAVGELLGPLELEDGYAIAKVTGRREAGRDEVLFEQLALRGLNEGTYRDYVRDLALDEAFSDYFASQVATEIQPQRKIAQIFIAAQQGPPAPGKRVRHILIAPLPQEPDQSAATEAEWQEALDKATEVRRQLLDGASWDNLALASNDPGSSGVGGDLGWWSPNPLDPKFVPQFEAALAGLNVGDISEPVRTEFGYHVIGITDERTSVAEQVEELINELREDPDSFAEVAKEVSEDRQTAQAGGELGWVARYEIAPELEAVVFAMTEPGTISDPIEVSDEGTYLLKLLDTAERRTVEPDRLGQIRAGAYPLWWEERLALASVWLAPEYDEGAVGAVSGTAPGG